MATHPSQSTPANEQNWRLARAHRFRRPPRLGFFRLVARAAGSSFSGWRDGRVGIPQADEQNLPANAQRRVDQANAWLNGKLARRYRKERNRLMARGLRFQASDATNQALAGQQTWAAPAGPASTEIAHRDQSSEEQSRQQQQGHRDSEEAFVGATADAHASLTETLTVTQTNETHPVTNETHPVRTHSRLLYVLVLLALFAFDAFLNKKAFEIFGDTDLFLWIWLGGFAAVALVGCHIMGQYLKDKGGDRRGRVILTILVALSIGVSAALGAMRYYSVDNDRQQTIRALEQQRSSASGILAAAKAERTRLLQIKPAGRSPAEKQALVITDGQIASANSSLASSKAQLEDERKPRSFDLWFASIPMFMMFNLFLFVVAVGLSYIYYNPQEARAHAVARAKRRQQRAEGRQRHRERAQIRKQQRETRRRVEAERAFAVKQEKLRQKGLADERSAALSATKERGYQSKQLQNLQRGQRRARAAAQAVAGALIELDATYRAACAEIERQHAVFCSRYWAAQNRQSRRYSRKLEREWNKAKLTAAKAGAPDPERPGAITWKRPLAQDKPLVFVRPEGLADS